MGPPLLVYFGSSIPRDRHSGSWIVVLTVYGVEVAVSWVREAWNSWTQRYLPRGFLSCLLKHGLRISLGDKNFSSRIWSLAVLYLFDETQIPLLHSHSASCMDTRSPDRIGFHEHLCGLTRFYRICAHQTLRAMAGIDQFLSQLETTH